MDDFNKFGMQIKDLNKTNDDFEKYGLQIKTNDNTSFELKEKIDKTNDDFDKFGLQVKDMSEIDNKNADYYFGMFKKFLKIGNYKSAMREIDKAIKYAKDSNDKKDFIDEKIKYINAEDYMNYFKYRPDLLFEYYNIQELIDIAVSKCDTDDIKYVINEVFYNSSTFKTIEQFYKYENFIENKNIIINYLNKNIDEIYDNFDSIKFTDIILGLYRYNKYNEEIELLILNYFNKNIKTNKSEEIYKKISGIYLDLIFKDRNRKYKIKNLINLFIENDEEKELMKFIDINFESKLERLDLYITTSKMYITSNKFIEIEIIITLFNSILDNDNVDYNKLKSEFKKYLKSDYRYKGIVFIIISELNINIMKTHINKYEKKKLLRESMSNLKYADTCSYKNKTLEYKRIIYQQTIILYKICNISNRKIIQVENKLNDVNSKLGIEKQKKTKGNKGMLFSLVSVLLVATLTIGFGLHNIRNNDINKDLSKNKKNSNYAQNKDENINEDEEISKIDEDSEVNVKENTSNNESNELPTRYSSYEDYDYEKKELYLELEDAISEYYSDYEQAMYYRDYSYVRDDVADGSPLSNELKNRLPKNNKEVYVKHFYIYNLEDNGYSAEFNMDTVFIIDNSKIQIETRKFKVYDSKYINKWVIDSLSNFDIVYQQAYDPNFDFENYRDYL